jgi:ornithine cyclodeaminase/alanine dehydrogenase-like protein (mu-crystallin family)
VLYTIPVILLHYALELQGVIILFDTETGNKKRLIDITKLAQQYQQELCTALLGLHAFTRCDTTSAFKGIGAIQQAGKSLHMQKQIF